MRYYEIAGSPCDTQPEADAVTVPKQTKKIWTDDTDDTEGTRLAKAVVTKKAKLSDTLGIRC